MGMVLIHGDLIERIQTISTTEGLEYKITTAIQKLNNKVSALLGLQDKIHVKLYLSSSLYQMAPYIGLKNLSKIPDDLERIVQKLNQKNYNKLEFKYLDPSADEDLEAIAKNYNIMTVKWPALAQGAVPPGKGAIGLVTEFGERALITRLLQVIRFRLSALSTS